MLGFWPKERVDFARDLILDEFNDWLTDEFHDTEPAPWMFFIFADAGIPFAWAAGIGAIEDEEVQEEAVDFIRREFQEQVLNASRDQVAGYAQARSTWIEMP